MKKILVIEDEEQVRNNTLNILQLEGYFVSGAQNGYEGVVMARATMPDLILCDINMPGMNGYQVLETLSQDSSTSVIPFIFLTSRTGSDDLRYGMELGADDYLTKPFTVSQLLKAVTIRLYRKASVDKFHRQKMEDLTKRLSNNLPHEFITPLSTILMYSEFMLSEYDWTDADQGREMVKYIRRGALRLEKLVRKFLRYADYEIITRQPDKAKEYRRKYIPTTRDIVTRVAKKKADEYSRESDLELQVADSPAQISEKDLEMLVTELVDNCFKFSPAGTPVRVVCIGMGSKFIMHFIDRGKGMTEEQIAGTGAGLQFNRTLYEQPGTGLGLATAKLITQIYNGELTIDSTPEYQTRIRVILPANESDVYS